MSRLMKIISKYVGGSRKKNGKEKNEVGLTPHLNDSSNVTGQFESEEEKEEEMSREDVKNDGKLFVGGLNFSTTPQQLTDYFSLYGKVLDSSVPRCRKSGKSKGFGFVLFANPKDAKTVLKNKYHFLNGKTVKVREYYTKLPNVISEKSCKNSRVFVGGLAREITEEDLREFFSKYGTVVSVVIPFNKVTETSKGFGFVQFKEEEAAEKCLADGFVYLKGRRVHLMKAKPRNQSKNDDLSSCNCSENNFNEALGALELADEDTQSVVSEEEFTTVEENPAIKTVFENYFLEKLVRFDVMEEKKFKDQDTETTEVEKLLADFLTLSNDNRGTTSQNLIEFSDEETESNDAAGFLQHNSAVSLKKSWKSNKKLKKKPSPPSKENFHLKAGVVDVWKSSASQKSMSPLVIRNREGFLMCSICNWISPNESTESFLAHCKSSEHKKKLKDRFPDQNDKESQNIDSKPKSASEKLSMTSRHTNKVNNTEKHQKEQQKPTVVGNKKNNQEVDSANKIKDAKQETTEAVKLKMHALAKGMTCIQPFSEDELMCTMCSKKIPKALEFDVLMKNVSCHLQSKAHIKNLSKTENSLANSYKANSPVFDDCKEKKNQNQKNLTPLDKIKNVAEPNKARAFKKLQKDPKVKNSAVAKNHPKMNPEESQVAVDNRRFLCLPCNVTCQNIEIFNVHLCLTSHTETLFSKNVKADVSLANIGQCKGCKIYLYGSLFHINKHYSKCIDKNN